MTGVKGTTAFIIIGVATVVALLSGGAVATISLGIAWLALLGYITLEDW